VSHLIFQAIQYAAPDGARKLFLIAVYKDSAPTALKEAPKSAGALPPGLSPSAVGATYL
jgi:hypothetical protein